MTLFFSLIISFLTIHGFRFSITENGYQSQNLESFVWLLLFLFFAWFIANFIRESNRRLKVYSVIFGLIIAVFYSIGINFEKRETMTWIWTSRSNLINFLNLFFSQFILYTGFAFLTFRFLRNRPEKDKQQTQKSFSRKRFFVLWGILLLVYIPWYLYCYPGNLTYDSGDMIRDALSTGSLYDHHSAFLTLVLRGILIPVRNWTGSIQIAVGVCTCLQMVLLTFVFALCCERIWRYCENRVLKGLAFLWFALYPVHPIYSVTLWKDIPFAICFLVLMLLIDSAIEDQDSFFRSKGQRAWMSICLVLLPLTRHNGVLITVLLPICLFLYFKQYRKQIVVLCCSSFLLLGIWNYVVMPAMHVIPVGKSLMLSLPQQQLARVFSLHYEQITPEETALYESYYDIPQVWNRYEGTFADPVKDHFNEQHFQENPQPFLDLWLHFLKWYPIDFLEAFFHNSYGYWFPETQFWISSYGVITGYPVIEGLHTAPIWKCSIVDGIYNWYAYHHELKYPLLPLFFSRGACWWIWVFCGIWCLYRNRSKFLLFLPGLFLWMSILVSPVYDEYRYVYGLFIALPLLLTSTLKRPKANISGDNCNIPEL